MKLRTFDLGWLGALALLLLFFKAIEFADSITGRHTIEQLITYPSTSSR